MPIQLISHDFLLCRDENKNSLARLTNDIIIDHIYAQLDVYGILAMRRVSKLFYYLTLEAIVWKRLLLKVDFPLPPLPPTSRYSYSSLTSIEAERILRKALSIEKNWRQDCPNYYDRWQFEAHHRVHGMFILPGGHYLVASVSDRACVQYFIMVFSMDHPSHRALPLCKMQTDTKAFGLHAKYLTIGGERSIVFSYVQRALRRKLCTDEARRTTTGLPIDISQFSGEHDIDISKPFKFESHTMYVSIAELEKLGASDLVPGSAEFLEHAQLLPPPFHPLSYMMSNSTIEFVTHEDIDGVPYFAAVKRPNRIVIKDLLGGPPTIISCNPDVDYPDLEHRIQAIRILPSQRQILVVRSIKNADVEEEPHPKMIHAIELYQLPHNPTSDHLHINLDADESDLLSFAKLGRVYITDPYTTLHNDESLFKDLYGTQCTPRPISIIATGINPDGVVRLTLYPEEVEEENPLPPAPPSTNVSLFNSLSSMEVSEAEKSVEVKRRKYRYSTASSSTVKVLHALLNEEYRILPGSYRSILYTIPWDDISAAPRVLRMYRYFDEESVRKVPLEEETEDDPVDEDDIGVLGDYFAAMAWDETVGRLCLCLDEGEQVFVVDFASGPIEDKDGVRFPPNPPEIINE
ncbi:hypothetical protein ABKN59_006837 [Abortiporus biennis]